MRAIPFRFFARIVLLTISFILAVLSLTNHVSVQEFAFAAGSIATAMLATSIKTRKKHTGHHVSGSNSPTQLPKTTPQL